MADYSTYKNQNVTHKKLGDFVHDTASYGYGLDLSLLLNYSADSITKNIDLIYAAIFTQNQELASQWKTKIQTYQSTFETQTQSIPTPLSGLVDEQRTILNKQLDQIPFPQDCVIYIPFAWVDRSLNSTQSTNFIVSTDYESFLAKKLYDLLNDKQYKADIFNKEKSINSIKDIYSNITVWVWSKGLSKKFKGQEKQKVKVVKGVDNGQNVTVDLRELDTVEVIGFEEDDYEDVIVDITPFIYNLSTNVTETGGNFSFNIAPILAEFKDNKWVVDEKSVKLGKDRYVADTHFHAINSDNSLKRNQIYFNNIFQANDVVFIRFEKLEMDDQFKDYVFEIDKADLPYKIYDMIGLIDKVGESYNGASNDLTISVNGRDLIKLFIEDGIYFYPYQFTNGGIFANHTGANNEHLQRYGNGDIRTQYQFFNKTLESTLKYVINSLSTISICSDSLFEYYENRRTDAYRVNTQDIKQQEKVTEKDKRRKEIFKLIDKAREKDKLDQYQDESTSAVYNKIASFVQSIIDKNVQIDKNGVLQGWGTFQHLPEILEKNEIIYALENSLFKPRYSWRLPDGRLVDSKEKIAYIQKVQADAKQRLAELQKDVDLSKEDFKYKEDLGVLDSAAVVALAEATKNFNVDKAIEDQTNAMIAGMNAALDAKREAAFDAERLKNNPTNNRLTPEDKRIGNTEYLRVLAEANKTNPQVPNMSVALASRERDAAIEDAYKELETAGQGISLAQLPNYFDKLTNQYAVQAIQKTYELINDKDLQKEDKELLAVKGIWQIIKLVIDDSVANRRIVDSSIGNENGSLLSAMNKICVKPFAEFYTDTYGDEFNLVIRKQPFDKESIISYLDKRIKYKTDRVQVEEDNLHQAKKDNKKGTDEPETVIIELDEVDVISTNLSFDSTAYSWYRLKMVNPGGGSQSSMAFAYLKAIYFKEYASIFGSKPLEVATNYIPYVPLPDKNDKIPNSAFVRQGILDLKYLIEANSYLPFTRKGTIVINGNRTIKRGTFIKLKSSNEIFYVDSVNNTYNISSNSIERTTTLNVSRGMVENFIKGEFIGKINYSYFDICQTPIDDKIFKNNELQFSSYSEAISNTWKVNNNVFNFFLKRYQFADMEQLRKLLGDSTDKGANSEAVFTDFIV